VIIISGVGGIIFDVDHFAGDDGPGIRSVVYFKGCPLRCVWCHSPESQSAEPESIFIKSNCNSCYVCADEGCINGAQRTCGYYVSVRDLLDEILPQRAFFDSSGGGVTLSGGEPLIQQNFITELLQELQKEKIHTIIETSLMCDPEVIRSIYPLVDTFYCDVKVIDPDKHKRYTGYTNDVILSNIELLSRLKGQTGIVLRVPLIPDHTDSSDDITEIYKFAVKLGISNVHLLPYNPSAPAKYEWLKKKYPLGVLERQSTHHLNELISIAPDIINAKTSGT